MAGTITISTLSDGTNSTSATNPILGSAKAWVNYNAVAQTITGSYNVSSVTYNSTGDFTINFTTVMTAATYATNVSIGPTQGTVADIAVITSYTTSTVRISTGYFYDVSKSAINYTTTNVSVFSS
jgi:hypothetical protein